MRDVNKSQHMNELKKRANESVINMLRIVFLHYLLLLPLHFFVGVRFFSLFEIDLKTSIWNNLTAL